VLGTDTRRDAVGPSRGKPKDAEEDSIYAPNIRLEYTPPVTLPSPLPRTMSVEGARSSLCIARAAPLLP
jgi:hypothetical protein